MSIPFSIKDFLQANKRYKNLPDNEKVSIKLNAQKVLQEVLNIDNNECKVNNR